MIGLRDAAADNRRALGTGAPWGKALGDHDCDNSHSDISKGLIISQINNCLFLAAPVTLFRCRWQMSVRSDRPIPSLPEGPFKAFFIKKKKKQQQTKTRCVFSGGQALRSDRGLE